MFLLSGGREMKGRAISWLFPVFYIVTALFIVGVVLSVQSFTENKNENKIWDEKASTVSQDFDLPDSLDFAGEPVPLDNFDTRESLDRELLVNGYWHSRTLLVLKKAKRYFAIILKLINSEFL